MGDLIQLRRDTAANLTTANRVYALGEPVLETDTGWLKYGDGVTAWDALPYAAQPANIINEGTATTFTLDVENVTRNTLTRMTDDGALTVVLPTSASLGWTPPRGALFGIRAAGLGGVTAWTTTGLTINGTLPVLAQHEEVWLRAVAPDEYDVVL